VGIDAIPLRTQPDRRLVRLVREGYESAFEEIVRRYRRPLDRFAASIVGGRSEDVTQDSFRKALEALRRDDAEIDLRPWLYRIVRNTALNDLRDRPPAAAELAEDLMAGGRSAAAVAEQRAEVAALTEKLRALPENQRAALVMRELEGMSHDQIAATLGISHGAARQAIARGRAAVRNGLGALVPLPLLRALASGGDAATEGAVGGGAAAATGAGGAASAGAAGGAGATTAGGVGVGASGIGAGGAAATGATGVAGVAGVAGGSLGASLLGGGAALKAGIATVVVAGGIGAGVAIDHHGGDRHPANPPKAVAHAPAPAEASGGPGPDRVDPSPSPVTSGPAAVEVDDRRPEDHRHGDRHHGSGSGHGHGSGDERETGIESEAEVEHSVGAAPTVVDDPAPKLGGSGGGGPGPSRSSGDHGASGRSGDDRSGHDGGGSGSGSSGSSSGDGGHGSDDLTEAVAEAPIAETLPTETVSPETSSSGGPGPSSTSSSSGGHGSDDGFEISP
jgi:RNA polymerase sigma factor (sigma-70 family)